MSAVPVPTDEPALLDAAGVARLLAISPRSVWRMADAGDLPPPIRIGRLCRWSRSAVVAWIDRQTAPPTQR